MGEKNVKLKTSFPCVYTQKTSSQTVETSLSLHNIFLKEAKGGTQLSQTQQVSFI